MRACLQTRNRPTVILLLDTYSTISALLCVVLGVNAALGSADGCRNNLSYSKGSSLLSEQEHPSPEENCCR